MTHLTDIKEHLEVLNLSTTCAPTMKEYKQAYRELMKLHPDLGGDTARFQEITLAARMVFEYITTHQGEQARPESDDDDNLIKAFEASNKVDYNNGNVVFGIDPKESSLWVQYLTKRLGKPLPLEQGNALQFKMEDFRLPRQSASTKSNYGTVTVTLWPNPKTTTPKAMVQGRCYMAFITFILPLIIKDIKNVSKHSITEESLELGNDEEGEHEGDQVEGDTATDTATSKALGRLEKELLVMRDDMAGRFDAVVKSKTASDFSLLDKRLESLENLLRQNIEQNSRLSASLDSLKDSLSRNTEGVLCPEQVEQLAKQISSSQNNQITEISTTVTAIRGEMALASSLHEVQNKVDSINPLLDLVHTAALKIDYNVNDMRKEINKTNEITNNEMIQVRKNSDNSLTMFEEMMKSLKNIEISNSKTSPTLPQAQATSNSSKSTPEPDIPLRKGVMFASSIALDTDIQRYKEELNVDLKVIPTYYIKEHPNSRDPDAYLGCMVNQHLRGKVGYNFAIFATGTNDISDLDCNTSPPTTLFSEVSEQSRTLFDMADSIAKEMDIDVFVIDKPPRYDASSDPTGMKQKLTKFANGALASNTGATPRIFLVEQASLARSSIKAREDIYQRDGLHLTSKGLNFYTSNIIGAMKDCYPDTQLLPKQAGARETATPGHVHGQRESHGQLGARDRGVGQREGYGRGYRGQRDIRRRDRGRDTRERRGQGDYHHNPRPYPPATQPWGGRGGGRWDKGQHWDYPDLSFGGGYSQYDRRGYY